MTSSTLAPESLVCDHSPDTPARGTGADLAADLARPGHNSYIYLGANQNFADFRPDDILAYDRPSNHDNQGVNILAADGHSEWILLGSLRDELARRRPQPTQPASRHSN